MKTIQSKIVQQCNALAIFKCKKLRCPSRLNKFLTFLARIPWSWRPMHLWCEDTNSSTILYDKIWLQNYELSTSTGLLTSSCSLPTTADLKRYQTWPRKRPSYKKYLIYSVINCMPVFSTPKTRRVDRQRKNQMMVNQCMQKFQEMQQHKDFKLSDSLSPLTQVYFKKTHLLRQSQSTEHLN